MLVQTNYLEEIGAVSAGGGDDAILGFLDGGGGHGSGEDGGGSYKCALCSKSGFR